MAYTRTNQVEDIRANRSWTADAEVDLADIPVKHGDVAYVTATTDAHVYVDGAGWVNISAGGGDVSDGDTLTTGLTFPNTGLHILDTNASHDLVLVPGSDLTADRNLTITTGDVARTLTLSGDATLSGGTHSGTNTGDVTLAGTPDYITISGQVITRGLVDQAADVTGILPTNNGGTGSNLNPVTGQLLSGLTGITQGTFELVNAGDVNEVLQGGGGSSAPSFTSTPSLDAIVFPATQAASAGANTLDDYEEGTWTPALAFGGGTTGIAYTYQVGTYVKVGQQVTINGHITLSSKGSSTGAATLTGLPFSTDSTANSYWVISVAYSYGMNTFTHPLIVLIGAGGTSGTFYQNGTYSAINDTHFQNTSQLIFQLTYRADN